MNITWYGQSCFKIQTKAQRGGKETTIITDPFDKSYGLRPPQGNAEIVLVSHTQHNDHNNTKVIKGDPFIIDASGEYSIEGTQIEGIESFHDKVKGAERGRNTIFTIDSEGVKICHLGDLGHILEENQVEAIGEVDILMIPVGGTFTLDSKEAEEVVGQLEPKIIIPMHFKVEGLTLELDDADKFCKEYGGKTEKGIAKLNIKKKELDEIETKVVVMEINK
jgi:L-ascorbate metabolism protein UlaG (beta-lactamase superfamily)